MDRELTNSKRAGGFTLIELVVVITILGILAAFAVPKFIALQKVARVASIQSLSGSLRSAVSMTHSMWLITGRGTSVPMEGTNIDMVDGYPTYASIVDTLMDASGFNYDPSNGQFSKVGATNAFTCSVTYTPPVALGAPSNILIDASDCG